MRSRGNPEHRWHAPVWLSLAVAAGFAVGLNTMLVLAEVRWKFPMDGILASIMTLVCTGIFGAMLGYVLGERDRLHLPPERVAEHAAGHDFRP